MLKPKTGLEAHGGTPLYDTTLMLLKMLTALPDADKPDVSFLVMMTTDGEATDHDQHAPLKASMKPLLATGRWTFVARVPSRITKHDKARLLALGIPEGNIQAWDTTAAGMAESTAKTTQAMDSYFTACRAGEQQAHQEPHPGGQAHSGTRLLRDP